MVKARPEGNRMKKNAKRLGILLIAFCLTVSVCTAEDTEEIEVVVGLGVEAGKRDGGGREDLACALGAVGVETLRAIGHLISGSIAGPVKLDGSGRETSSRLSPQAATA